MRKDCLVLPQSVRKKVGKESVFFITPCLSDESFKLCREKNKKVIVCYVELKYFVFHCALVDIQGKKRRQEGINYRTEGKGKEVMM